MATCRDYDVLSIIFSEEVLKENNIDGHTRELLKRIEKRIDPEKANIIEINRLDDGTERVYCDIRSPERESWQIFKKLRARRLQKKGGN